VAGFKPAFGRLSVEGVYPLSWSLDTIGPQARTVADTRLLWDALRGDVRFVAGDGTPGSDGPFRVGVSRPYFWDGLQSDVRSAVDAALATMQEAGIAVVAVDWPLAAAARAGAFIINRVETAAVHERVAREEPERFAQYGRELQLRVAAGREIPAGAYIEAQRARPLVRDAMAALFTLHRLDAIVAPTLPTTAPAAENPIVSGTGRDESLGAAWTRLTMPFNATGQPVLALPCGRDQEGLPIGLQLAGRPGQEAVLFDLGQAVEAALGWQPEAPPLAVGRREAGTARMG
jgi:aspartyl-tRNA(Asn)/glutamyl-tRNA(Gln) amidotransferase subunit A